MHLAVWEKPVGADRRLASLEMHSISLMFAGIENIHFWIIHPSSVGYHPFKDPPPPTLCTWFVFARAEKTQKGDEEIKKKRVVFQPWNISSRPPSVGIRLVISLWRRVEESNNAVRLQGDGSPRHTGSTRSGGSCGFNKWLWLLLIQGIKWNNAQTAALASSGNENRKTFHDGSFENSL